ncbi:neuronal cell adhesion molecule-like [Amphiura filiformis]|uniref:neuronal cell adhesion molecule-like n=1 Tax=Amphiura filiformis TaxID=82378 RepID=UPI003B223F11
MSSKHATPEKRPSMNPGGVTGSGPEPGLMVVQWEPMIPEDYAGPDFKYIVRYKAKGETEWTEEPVNKNKNKFEVRSDVLFQEYDIEVVSENAVGRSTATPESVTGFSGESEPTAAPSDVKVDVLNSDTIEISWTDVPADSVNGKIQGYRAYYSIVIAANSEEMYECNASPCIVAGLQPFSTYSLQLAVFNGKGAGPKSDPEEFIMPEGKPSAVNDLEVKASSDRILATWEKPDNPNGVLTGYDLIHERMMGLVVENNITIEIPDPDQTRQIIENLKPDTKYKITVKARTSAGAGEKVWAETSTRPEGKPVVPAKPVFKEIGTVSMNVSYELPLEGPGADYISIKYYKKGEDKSKAKTTETIDIFEEDAIHVKNLSPNTKYLFQVIAKNDDGSTPGEWDEAKTIGTGAQAAGFKVEAWFVILIVIIILLLLILLIICVLKSQKGGKYNVSDKEQQLKGDIESTPLKDEGGFEEFQPRDGNLDDNAPLTQGSHPSLNESEAGSSETDSVKEYAEGGTGKFNEEGSFIGQYGDRKTRPPDEGQDGAAYSTFV